MNFNNKPVSGFMCTCTHCLDFVESQQKLIQRLPSDKLLLFLFELYRCKKNSDSLSVTFMCVSRYQSSTVHTAESGSAGWS